MLLVRDDFNIKNIKCLTHFHVKNFNCRTTLYLINAKSAAKKTKIEVSRKICTKKQKYHGTSTKNYLQLSTVLLQVITWLN